MSDRGVRVGSSARRLGLTPVGVDQMQSPSGVMAREQITRVSTRAGSMQRDDRVLVEPVALGEDFDRSLACGGLKPVDIGIINPRAEDKVQRQRVGQKATGYRCSHSVPCVNPTSLSPHVATVDE